MQNIIQKSTNNRVVMEFLETLDCPRALTVWLLYSNMEHKQLSELEFTVDHYTECTFTDAYLATAYLSKSTFLQTENDLKNVALVSFSRAEEQCRTTNHRIRAVLSQNIMSETEYLLSRVRRKIANILGDFNPNELIDSCGWGPGVTQMLKSDTSASNKFHLEGGITRDLYDFVQPWFSTAYPMWAPNWEFAVGNKIVTVPKNAKTDRTIAIEPGVNLWFQKGIGSMIRRRLLREGISLNTQRTNAARARLGSLTGHLATVDFKAASDTISKELVRAIMPDRWFTLLDVSRSLYGQIQDSQPFEYEKFSSMGNGFTFELESLIFYALASVICYDYGVDARWVSVYGDDVIIPSDVYQPYIDAANEFGFVVNTSKSFSGYCPFRESCGEHFYKGRSVKPFIQKDKIDIYDRHSVFLAANSIRRLAHRLSGKLGCDVRFERVWNFLFSLKDLKKFRISEHYGDGGFICNFDEAAPTKARYGIEGYYTRYVTSRPVTVVVDHLGLLLARLHEISVRTSESDPLVDHFQRLLREESKCGFRLRTLAYNNQVSIRGRSCSRVSRLYVSQWYDLGPWC